MTVGPRKEHDYDDDNDSDNDDDDTKHPKKTQTAKHTTPQGRRRGATPSRPKPPTTPHVRQNHTTGGGGGVRGVPSDGGEGGGTCEPGSYIARCVFGPL